MAKKRADGTWAFKTLHAKWYASVSKDPDAADNVKLSSSPYKWALRPIKGNRY
jgi:hypothetical protein